MKFLFRESRFVIKIIHSGERCRAPRLIHVCCQYFQNTNHWIVSGTKRLRTVPVSWKQRSEHLVALLRKGVVECIWLSGRKVINYALLNETIINCHKTRIKGRDMKPLRETFLRSVVCCLLVGKCRALKRTLRALLSLSK